MEFYKGKSGSVTKGFLTSFRFHHKDAGRTFRPTPAMKNYMATLHNILRSKGRSIHSDPFIAAAYWEHLLDMSACIPNGLTQQVTFSQPEQEADHIIERAKLSER